MMELIRTLFTFVGGLVVLVILGLALRAVGEWFYHWILDWNLVCEYLWHRKQFKQWLKDRRAAGKKTYER